MWVLALGPGGDGQDPASLYRPYSWLLGLPGFNGLRVPARFAMLGTLVPRDGGEPRRRAPVETPRLARTARRPDGWTRRWRALAGTGGRRRPPRRRHDAPGPGRHASREMILPGSATGGGDRAAGRRHRCQRRRPCIDRCFTASRSSTATRATFRRTTTSWRCRSRGWTPRASSTWRRRRPLVIIVNDEFDHEPQFQGHGRGTARHPAAGVTGAGSVFSCRPRRRRVSHQPDRRSRRPCATPAVPPRARSRRAPSPVGGRVRAPPALRRPRAAPADRDIRGWSGVDGVVGGWTGGMAVEATLADPALAPMRIPLAGVRARYLRVYPAAPWMKTAVTVREHSNADAEC